MANKKQRRKMVVAFPAGLACCPNCGVFFCSHLGRADRMYCDVSCKVSASQKRALNQVQSVKKQQRKVVMALPTGLACCPNCSVYFCPHLKRADRMYCGASCKRAMNQAKEIGLEPLPTRLPTTTADRLASGQFN